MRVSRIYFNIETSIVELKYQKVDNTNSLKLGSLVLLASSSPILSISSFWWEEEYEKELKNMKKKRTGESRNVVETKSDERMEIAKLVNEEKEKRIVWVMFFFSCLFVQEATTIARKLYRGRVRGDVDILVSRNKSNLFSSLCSHGYNM